MWLVCIYLNLFMCKYTSPCIRIRIYTTSYIYSWAIMLTRFPFWFWNILVVNKRWLQVALIVFVPSCINFSQALWAQVIAYLKAWLMDYVFFRSRSWHALHPFTNFMNNVVIHKCLVLNVEQHVINNSNSCGYQGQVVYSHYMLTPSMECLDCDTFVLRKKISR